MKTASIASVVAILALSINPSDARAASGNITITGIQLNNFQIVNNVLHASGTVTGTLAGQPFTTQITDFALQLVPDNPATTAVECAILDLQLAPIHLALLGLHVDTSPICLEITAIQGGGLLGDLLCGLAGGGLLGTGTPIIPTGATLDALLAELTELLRKVLGGNPGHGGGGHQPGVCTGTCEILDLVLGPLDLTLLGVNVHLDNCAGGPVEICVSATAGEGLLGNLLCSLTNVQILNLDLADITQLATKALSFLADGRLTQREIDKLTSLLFRLIR